MIRVIGACCIFVGCGGFGFSMAAASRREEAELGRMLAALEYMSCELAYRLTPLPELCRGAACGSSGMTAQLLNDLAQELEQQTAPDVQVCVFQVLHRHQPPKELRRVFRELGDTLGLFDLPGQLKGLERSIRTAEDALRRLRDGAPERRRSCQTLALCVGAAMAILFL